MQFALSACVAAQRLRRPSSRPHPAATTIRVCIALTFGKTLATHTQRVILATRAVMTVPSRCCVVCFEPPSEEDVEGGGIMCAGAPGHLVCPECIEPLVLAKVEELKTKVDLDNGASPGQLKALSGFVFCPCRGVAGGCTSEAPYTDRDLALAVSADTFSVYLEGRNLKRNAEAERDAYLEAQQTLQEELDAMRAVATAASAHGSRLLAKQLKRSMPDARMCAVCRYGPMDHRDCADLAAHHGQVLESGARIDNACPKCGFFSADKADWPLWDGTLAEDGMMPGQGSAAPLVDAATARELVEAEVSLAQERQERAERRAEQAIRSRKAVEAHARGLRSSLLESVNDETQRRKKEHELRKRAEAEAAEERERRQVLERTLSQRGDRPPALIPATPLRATLSKHAEQPPAAGRILRPISAPARRVTQLPALDQATGTGTGTGGCGVGAEGSGVPVSRRRPRPASAPVMPHMGVGSLQATLRQARREAGLP